ncbi:hypothetical protein CBI38_16710 [Rhodococcus oxybenzonivorans]|uniref:Uncharacterized protein n=1 Tax=Rhodococcus oxybenzonivorans TaxID=1990687 RepID=A0A2S2BWI3_9NOCA|nr:hypothetical protein CBI38_16710 [Rhodococcus oxybenzonivorans]
MGEFECPGHLVADPDDAARGGVGQPAVCALVEGDQMRVSGQHVLPIEFCRLSCGRGGPDRAVRAGVDLLAPPLTGVEDFDETRVFLEQVRLGRHETLRRDLDRVLGAALRSRVERSTGVIT